MWQRPVSACLKLNFDGGNLGEKRGGWLGVAIHNSDSDLVLAGTKQGVGFAGAEVEEARACLLVSCVTCAKEANLDSLIVEGDSLSLIHKLRKKLIYDSFVGHLFSKRH